MVPGETDVRRWYVASIALGIPWWVFLAGHLKLIGAGYLIAWPAAVPIIPKVAPGQRLLGVAVTLGLTLGLWLLLLVLVGQLLGDGESQGRAAP